MTTTLRPSAFALAAAFLASACTPSPFPPSPPEPAKPPSSPRPSPRAAPSLTPPAPLRFSFDGDPTGALPPGWKTESTHPKGPVATWLVVRDDHAPSAPNILSLIRINHTSSDTFNLCWTDVPRFLDGDIEVSFRADSGKDDQGGGLIWRIKDKDTYLLARMNPLEDNLRIYYVLNGARTQLASAAVSAAPGTWHTLRIEQHANAIRGFLDGTMRLETTDAHIPAPGGVGLWTKADAATSFDNLTITPAPSSP
jgi:hypothetical protein